MERIRTIVVAAAGRGTRMKDLTQNKPKQMIEIFGRPFLSYVLAGVRAAGFKRIIVVVGHFGEAIREYVAGLPYPVEVVDQYAHTTEKYGTAVVAEVVADIVGDEACILQNGDWVYTPQAYDALLSRDGFSRVTTMEHEHPEYFGVIEKDGELLKHIAEKPEQPKSHLINAGLYAFEPTIFAAVADLKPSPRGEYEITDAINVLAAAGRVKIAPLKGAGIELGKPEDIASVEQFVKAHGLI